MSYNKFIKRYWSSISFATIWEDFHADRDPNFMSPIGSQVYCGKQGEGKTFALVFHSTIVKYLYPKAIVVSNVKLLNMKPREAPSDHTALKNLLSGASFKPSKEYLLYSDYKDIIFMLRYLRNGDYGVIFIIDEMHQYFHSHDSKSIPAWVPQVFSQQRKQRILILGSAQKWEDVIKTVRDQLQNVIICSRFGYFIRTYAFDPDEITKEFGNSNVPIKNKGWIFMNKETLNSYDTFQVINSGRQILGGSEMSVNVVGADEKQKAKTKRKW